MKACLSVGVGVVEVVVVEVVMVVVVVVVVAVVVVVVVMVVEVVVVVVGGTRSVTLSTLSTPRWWSQCNRTSTVVCR